MLIMWCWSIWNFVRGMLNCLCVWVYLIVFLIRMFMIPIVLVYVVMIVLFKIVLMVVILVSELVVRLLLGGLSLDVVGIWILLKIRLLVCFWLMVG